MVDTRDLISRVNCLKKSCLENIGTLTGSNPVSRPIPWPARPCGFDSRPGHTDNLERQINRSLSSVG